METHFKIGDRVQTMREYSGVPKFTEGMIISDYGTGMMVAWDRPQNPILKDMTPQEIADLPATNPICPLRDGFDKETELPELVLVTNDVHPLRQLDGFINTFTGTKINLTNPDPSQIRIEDIAKGLAYKGHFGGQTPNYFSIAQHCVLVCELMPTITLQENPELMMVALLHDASEAYIGDMVKPLKIHLPNFQKVENRLQEVIFESFGLDIEMISEIKPYDLRAQDYEYLTFYKGENRISKYLNPEEAYNNFMDWYRLLIKEMVSL